MDDALDLIAKVNQPGKAFLQIRTPLPPDDARVLHEGLAWLHEVRSRQAGSIFWWNRCLSSGLSKPPGELERDRAAVGADNQRDAATRIAVEIYDPGRRWRTCVSVEGVPRS